MRGDKGDSNDRPEIPDRMGDSNDHPDIPDRIELRSPDTPGLPSGEKVGEGGGGGEGGNSMSNDSSPLVPYPLLIIAI